MDPGAPDGRAFEYLHCIPLRMDVGILGSGDVAKALAKGFLDRGDHAMLGTRDTGSGKLDDWVASAGNNASVGTFREAAVHGEVVLLCTKGAVNPQVINAAGPDNLAGKTLIDVTNPLDASSGTCFLGCRSSDF